MNNKEKELRTSALAFESNSPLLIANSDQVVISVNKACVALSGFSQETIRGISLQALYTEGLYELTRSAEPAFLEFLKNPDNFPSQDCFTGKTVRVSKQGEVIHFIETITAIRDGATGPKNFVVYLQDVSSLVEAERALTESRQVYASLIESMLDGVILLDKSKVIDCNEQFARMLNRKKRDVIGRSIAELSVPVQAGGADSGERASQVFHSIIGGRTGGIEWTFIDANGTTIDVEGSLSSTSVEGKPVLLATVRDITERKQLDRERQDLVEMLAEKEEIIRLASQASGVISWVLDMRSKAIFWSDGAEVTLGLKPGTLGDTLDDIEHLMSEQQKAALDAALFEAVTTGKPLKLEMAFRLGMNDQEATRWLSIQGGVEFDNEGVACRVRGIVSDITEERRTKKEIERLAYYDPLTGLANRRLLLDRVQRSCNQGKRHGNSGAIFFLDLDRFKLLNDSLGHAVGDELLKEVAGRLKNALREEDTVARLGGDEFVVLAPSIEGDYEIIANKSRHIADMIRRCVSGEYKFDDRYYYLSCSIGVSVFPQDSTKASELLQYADAAMYLAKKSGRDAVAFYRTELQTEAEQRLALERGLRNATELDQLALFYQPKVDVRRERVTGAEALLRWCHPTQGLVMPDRFIPVAEETGLILSIGKWVLENACEQCVEWNLDPAVEEKFGIAVNVSPVQFRHGSFVKDVTNIIDNCGLDPALLTLEITEGILVENTGEAQRKLNELRSLGVRLSIDDFGTGYSSLYYLKNLPLDEIKIDRVFIKDIVESSSDAGVVASIMAIANNFGLSAVAEGVETQLHADYLKKLGCHLSQGYLYSKPLPAKEFARKFLTTGELNTVAQ